MNFQLPFEPSPLTQKLELGESLLSIGSCFSEHIADRLSSNKINCIQHPFGTLYHPLALSRALLPKKNLDFAKDVVSHDDIYFHWDAHSRLWGDTEEQLSERYKEAYFTIKQAVTNANWLIITLGSAYYYELKNQTREVANCHKQPQNEFVKKISTVDQVIHTLNEMHTALHEVNPSLQILYTVSPVRHYRDGLKENQISKGILLQSISHFSEHANIHYFPSYEIIIDQLRDYRFFKVDGIHPNDLAIDYVWNKLVEHWFSQNTKDFIKKWSPIRQALSHQPLYPQSKSHIQFVHSMIAKLENLNHLVDVTEEIEFFKSQLQS